MAATGAMLIMTFMCLSKKAPWVLAVAPYRQYPRTADQNVHRPRFGG
jgi:hypothetical protein